MPRAASGPCISAAGEPKIFDYADVLQCEVAEAGDPEAEEVASKQEFAQRILANPAQGGENKRCQA